VPGPALSPPLRVLDLTDDLALQGARLLVGTGADVGVLARDRTGQGQLVDVSGQEAVAATLETGAISWFTPVASRSATVASTSTSRTASSLPQTGSWPAATRAATGCGPTCWPGWSRRARQPISSTRSGATRSSGGRAVRTSTRSSPGSSPSAARGPWPRRRGRGAAVGRGRAACSTHGNPQLRDRRFFVSVEGDDLPGVSSRMPDSVGRRRACRARCSCTRCTRRRPTGPGRTRNRAAGDPAPTVPAPSTGSALGMEAARNRAFAWLSWADLR
jgi:hypothetical protein